MREREELNGLPPSLREAVRELRDEVAPTDIWRQRLLHEIGAAPRPAHDVPRRWTVRPLTAVAAGLVCALIGASAATVALRRPPAEPLAAPAGAAREARVSF
jgi:hypothetical protein